MDRKWKELLAALVMGLIAPQLMLGIGGVGAQSQQMPLETPTQIQTQPPVTEETMIPVLYPDGSVVPMCLEEYVLGVVLAEMPAEFAQEALKAQAVVSRSYALRRYILSDRHPQGAVCTDSGCCQAYMTQETYLNKYGTEKDIEKIRLAVKSTRQTVLFYEGQIAETTYFSCSGGRTEDAVAVWGEEIAYLQAVDSPGEDKAATYTASVTFTPERFAAALGRSLQGSPDTWLGQTYYTDGGGVALMFIGGIGYAGTVLREKLGLNSTAFSVSVEAEKITVTTRGKGHRVGMSQYGADAMALTGSSWEEILSHYYPGTIIDKMPPLG